MGNRRSLFVLGILALTFAACAPAAAPTSAPAATPTPAPVATPTSTPAATPAPTAAPAPAPATPKPRPLRMMTSAEGSPFQLSPIHGAEGIFSYVSNNVMEPPVDLGKSGEPVPKLAPKWEQRDATTWRLYLQRGVKFHNGADFTARDVVSEAKWVIEEKGMSKLYMRLPFKEAVAIDDYTVDVIFDNPQPLFLLQQREFVIPPTAISGDNRKLAGEQPMGTGPYRFVEWNRGRYIKLTRFEGYWGPKPQIDDVEIIFRAEAAVRLAALRVGEVDWVIDVGAEQADRAPKVASIPSPETYWIRFDEYILKELGGESILADKRLRLAIDSAIDRQALVALHLGFATPSLGQFASPGDFGFNPDLKSRPYDLERARALVREVGGMGKMVSLVSSTGRYAKDREVAEAVASMIEQTGLKVKLMLMPVAEAQKYKKVLGANRPYMSDLYISASDALLEVESRYPAMFVNGGDHYALNDPEPARLFKEVQAEPDTAKRAEKLGKAWAYVYEQAHYVPLFKLPWIWGIAKNLEWKVDLAGRVFVADMRFTD